MNMMIPDILLAFKKRGKQQQVLTFNSVIKWNVSESLEVNNIGTFRAFKRYENSKHVKIP